MADWIDGLDRLLKVKELAGWLGLSGTDLYDMAREGCIPHIRIRGAIRFDPHAIASWLRAHQV